MVEDSDSGKGFQLPPLEGEKESKDSSHRECPLESDPRRTGSKVAPWKLPPPLLGTAGNGRRWDWRESRNGEGSKSLCPHHSQQQAGGGGG